MIKTIMDEAMRGLGNYDNACNTPEILNSADVMADSLENILLKLAELNPEIKDEITSFIEDRAKQANI